MRSAPPDPTAPSPGVLDRYLGDEIRPLYTGRVRVSGGTAAHGRASGVVRSDDGALALELRLPAELGGHGGGSNPEQLLAAGYAACFHGALMLLATRAGIALDDPCIEVTVTFSRDPIDGLFLLSAEVAAYLPGLACDVAAELVRNTERVCPYSKMFRNGITHRVSFVPHGAPSPDPP